MSYHRATPPHLAAAFWLFLLAAVAAPTAAGNSEPAPRLSETGLYVNGVGATLAPGVLSFTPQYPLWSDGAAKRRWIYLPPGSHIDAGRPDAWEFPVGTKLWKEFSHGRRVETRLIERLPTGAWRFVVYVWRADGSDADLAPAGGIRALPVRGAPGGKYVIPSQNDCRACHEGAAVPILGFSALQLSPDRDPNAPHAEALGSSDVNLPILAQRDLLRHFPQALLDQPPRIKAASASERAVLGYLHANCGHCHNDPGESAAGVPVELLLAQYVTRPDGSRAVRQSLATLERPETLVERIRTRDPHVQMPPLGSQVPDLFSLALIEHWISQELKSSQ